MKKFILLIQFSFLFFAYTYSQEPIQFEKVITLDSVYGKELIYTYVNDWFGITYVDSENVILTDDKASGIISGKSSLNYSIDKLGWGCYDGYINYTIKVFIKNDRFKIVLSDFYHSILPGNERSCELGLVTVAEKFATKGVSKSYHNKVWTDIKRKIDVFTQNIFLSIDKSVRKIETPSVDMDGW